MVIPGWATQAEKAGFSTLGTVGRVAYLGVMDTMALAAAAAATTSLGLLSTVMIDPAWPHGCRDPHAAPSALGRPA